MQQLPLVQTLKKVLILRGEGSLGDAILSSVCYRALKKSNPNLHITVVAFSSAALYLRSLSTIDEVYTLPIRKILRPNQYWLSLLWHAFKLRWRRYDLVMDSSAKNFYNWRLFKRIIGSDRVFDPFTYPECFRSTIHISSLGKEMVANLGAHDEDNTYNLPIVPAAQEKWEKFAKNHLSQGYILLNPFGSVPHRCLEESALQIILKLIAARGITLPVVIPFIPSFRQRVSALIKHFSYPVLGYETTSVFDLFAAVKSAQLVFTPDTSVVHIATGFHRKTIAFYNNYTVEYSPNNPLAVPIFTAPNSVSQFNPQEVAAGLRKLW